MALFHSQTQRHITTLFCWNENTRLVPILYCQCNTPWIDIIVFAQQKKCPLEIIEDDYFVTSNCAVYDAIQAAYIVLRIIGF